MGLCTRTLLLLLLVVLVVLLLADTASAQRRRRPRRRGQCRSLPPFMVNGVRPLDVARGQVTVAALLTSDCSFCVAQSERMQALHQSLQGNGTVVHMLIINGGPRPGPGEVGTFESIVSFPVYHDDDSLTIWRRVFQGNKDDIFVLDRCGNVTFRIPFPYSYLGYNYVERAISRTLTGNVCGDCSLQDPHDRMMGDAPHSSRFGARAPYSHRSNIHSNGRGHSHMPVHIGGAERPFSSYRGRNINRSRCPRTDRLCRDLRKARRRYNLFRRRNAARLRAGMDQEQILELFQRSQRGSRLSPAL